MAKKTAKAASSYRMNGSATKSSSNGASKKVSRKTEVTDEEESTRGSLLEDFFVDELKDIYWAEKRLVKALAKMAKKTTSDELRTAFEEHRTETEGHVSRLEEAFSMMNKKAQAKKCEAISGIIEEVEEIISDTEDDTFTRDVALIVGAQKVEHYEIATYGSLVQLARTLGRNDVADLLGETLEEEKNADSTLTGIAESHINEEAMAE